MSAQQPPTWGQPGHQAPAPPPKPFYRRGWFWVLVALSVGGLLFAACLGAVSTAVNEAADPEPTNNGVSQGLGTADATRDVQLGPISEPDAIGLRTGVVNVTNHSSATSDYYIEMSVSDANGTNIGYTNAVVNKLRPGQKARTEFQITEDDAAEVKITEVQRTASA